MAGVGRTESLGLQSCDDCSFDFPEDRTQCPHCGRPQLFPNVKLADAKMSATPWRLAFKQHWEMRTLATVEASWMCFTSPRQERRRSFVVRPQSSSRLPAGAMTYTQRFTISRELRFSRSAKPGQPDWNTARIKGAIDLLGGSGTAKKIHYAALSVDQLGVANYGEYAVVLRDDMISHRASVFQENTGVYFFKNPGAAPKGFRSNWVERGKLCVAKLEDRLTSASTPGDFPKLILKAAPNPLDDEFLEVQVFGPMTVRTFERVTRLAGTRNAPGNAVHLAIRDYLAKAGIKVEKQP